VAIVAFISRLSPTRVTPTTSIGSLLAQVAVMSTTSASVVVVVVVVGDAGKAVPASAAQAPSRTLATKMIQNKLLRTKVPFWVVTNFYCLELATQGLNSPLLCGRGHMILLLPVCDGCSTPRYPSACWLSQSTLTP
jgi:hypothetical protein